VAAVSQQALVIAQPVQSSQNFDGGRTMYPLKKSISIALGLLVLAGVAVLITTGTVGASPTLAPIAAAPPTPAIPVAVTNTPLPVQGNVNANVSGTVGVSSLPAVELSGTPTVNLNTTPTAPLYVDADRPARNSFSASCATQSYDPASGQASCTIFTIPAGREVVIESVACTAEVAAGQGPGQADLIVPNIPFGAAPGSAAYPTYIPLAMSRQTLNSGAGVDIWALTNQFRAYGQAPAQGSVDISVFCRASLPNLNPPQGMNCVIEGYLVP